MHISLVGILFSIAWLLVGFDKMSSTCCLQSLRLSVYLHLMLIILSQSHIVAYGYRSFVMLHDISFWDHAMQQLHSYISVDIWKEQFPTKDIKIKNAMIKSFTFLVYKNKKFSFFQTCWIKNLLLISTTSGNINNTHMLISIIFS